MSEGRSANDFDEKSLKVLSTRYLKAQLFIVVHEVDRA
jgi:hypothetical protein